MFLSISQTEVVKQQHNCLLLIYISHREEETTFWKQTLIFEHQGEHDIVPHSNLCLYIGRKIQAKSQT